MTHTSAPASDDYERSALGDVFISESLRSYIKCVNLYARLKTLVKQLFSGHVLRIDEKGNVKPEGLALLTIPIERFFIYEKWASPFNHGCRRGEIRTGDDWKIS